MLDKLRELFAKVWQHLPDLNKDFLKTFIADFFSLLLFLVIIWAMGEIAEYLMVGQHKVVEK